MLFDNQASSPVEILHGGLAMNSRKALLDYRHLRQRIQNAERNIDPVFDGVEQLFPEAIAKSLGFAPGRTPAAGRQQG